MPFRHKTGFCQSPGGAYDFDRRLKCRVSWGGTFDGGDRDRAARGDGIRGITGYQWLVLFIAWAAGRWILPDFTLYGLVLRKP